MSTYSLQRISGSQTVVTTAETVIATSPAVVAGPGSSGVWFSGDVQATWGTGATGAVYRLRYGSISGAIVDQTVALGVTPGANTSNAFNLYDLTNAPEQPGGQVYVLTLQVNGASANTTVNSGHFGIED